MRGGGPPGLGDDGDLDDVGLVGHRERTAVAEERLAGAVCDEEGAVDVVDTAHDGQGDGRSLGDV
jgi:hypothetical protein